MNSCTFFGHRDCDVCYKKPLEKTVINMILNMGVTNFYVGNNGEFDRLVLEVLRKMQRKYKITYKVVLAYENELSIPAFFDNELLYLQELDKVPNKYHIPYRNKWMINNSSYVVAGIRKNEGGAWKSVSYALDNKKEVQFVLPNKNIITKIFNKIFVL